MARDSLGARLARGVQSGVNAAIPLLFQRLRDKEAKEQQEIQNEQNQTNQTRLQEMLNIQKQQTTQAGFGDNVPSGFPGAQPEFQTFDLGQPQSQPGRLLDSEPRGVEEQRVFNEPQKSVKELIEDERLKQAMLKTAKDEREAGGSKLQPSGFPNFFKPRKSAAPISSVEKAGSPLSASETDFKTPRERFTGEKPPEPEFDRAEYERLKKKYAK